MSQLQFSPRPNKKELDEVQTEGQWEVVKCKLDSGACAAVFKPDAALAFELKETESSKMV